MSYADLIREELLELPIKRPCCRKALIRGLMADAKIQDGKVTAVYPTKEIAGFAAEQIKKQFSKLPELLIQIKNGRTYAVLHSSSKGLLKLTEELLNFGKTGDAITGKIGENADTSCKNAENAEQNSQRIHEPAENASGKAADPAGPLCVEKTLGLNCEGCKSAYLRGVFLACATLNDPHKSTHLEFLLKGSGCKAVLEAFFISEGYPPKITERKNGTGFYFKNSGSVEDLVALTGACRMAMDMMNVRIEREIRNNENRATNCVTKNIEKSVAATGRQIDAIERLTLTGMLAQLPEQIRYTALLRVQNPDSSLEELRLLHEPPITKSGLNHRLQRLLAEAEHCGKKN